MHRSRTRPAAALAAAGLIASAAAQTLAQPSTEVRWRKVILTGDDLPGTNGESFDFAVHVVMNRRGEVAFGASFETPDTEPLDSGLFVEIDGELRLLIRQGDPVDAIPNARHGAFTPLRMNYTDQNELVFYNRHDFGEGTASVLGIWRASTTGLTPIITGDGLFTDTDGRDLSLPLSPLDPTSIPEVFRTDHRGNVALAWFSTNPTSGEFTSGIWRHDGRELISIINADMPWSQSTTNRMVTGTRFGGGVVDTWFNMNGSGDLLFRGREQTIDFSGEAVTHLLLAREGQIESIVSDGTPTGLPDGSVFTLQTTTRVSSDFTMNDAGDLVFGASTGTPPTDSLWRVNPSGGFDRLVGVGDAGPGPSLDPITSVGAPRLTPDGEFYFFARLAPDDRSALLFWTEAGVVSLIEEGTPIGPHTRVAEDTLVFVRAFGADGSMLVETEIEDTAGTAEPTDALLVAFTDGRSPLVLAQVGTAFNVAPLGPVDDRIVERIGLFMRWSTGTEGGGHQYTNDRGEVLAHLFFTDGTSGIFVATLPNPCPADADRSGVLDFFDIIEYLGFFDAQDPEADFAPPFGTFDVFDVIDFLAAFDAGC